jgi:predicted nucleic acid-binding protein
MGVALFDTNILIDALHAHQEAVDELSFWARPAISIITFAEVYAGASGVETPKIKKFMAHFGFEVIHTDDIIMALATSFRRNSIHNKRKIALPDAIILATAQARRLLVVTRNKKDFKGPNVRIPYELETITTTRVINVRPAPHGMPS